MNYETPASVNMLNKSPLYYNKYSSSPNRTHKKHTRMGIRAVPASNTSPNLKGSYSHASYSPTIPHSHSYENYPINSTDKIKSHIRNIPIQVEYNANLNSANRSKSITQIPIVQHQYFGNLSLSDRLLQDELNSSNLKKKIF